MVGRGGGEALSHYHGGGGAGAELLLCRKRCLPYFSPVLGVFAQRCGTIGTERRCPVCIGSNLRRVRPLPNANAAHA